MYACNGILFNHESPRRGETFVTRKITRSNDKKYNTRIAILFRIYIGLLLRFISDSSSVLSWVT